VRGLPKLTFELGGFLPKKIDDLYSLDDQSLKNLRVELSKGSTVSGRLFDAAGNPMPATLVEILVGEKRFRQAAITDEAGRFRITGLPPGNAVLRAHAIPVRQKARKSLVLDGDFNDFDLRMEPYRLTAEPKRAVVLGLTLCDVTPELKDIYDFDAAQGALVVDLGKEPSPLRLNGLAAGDCFCVVGFARVRNVRDFVERLIADARKPSQEPDSEYSTQVFFKSRRTDFDGEDGGLIMLTNQDLDSLRKVLSDLKAKP
jgi:hypothetical protein